MKMNVLNRLRQKLPKVYKMRVILSIQEKARKGILLLFLCMILLASCNRRIMPEPEMSENIVFNKTLYDLTFVEGIKQKMLGNYGEAIRFLEQSLKLNPQSDAACFQISQISGIMGDKINAKKYAVMAAGLDDNNTWYKINLANMYMQESAFDSAAYHYSRVVDIEPEREDIKFQLGSILLELGDNERAEEIFNQFYEDYGASEQILFALLKTKTEQGKNSEAEALLLKASKAEPENSTMKGMLAELYREMGMKEKAGKIYMELLKEDSNNGLVRLSYADFLMEERMYEQVLESTKKLIEENIINKDEKIGLIIRMIQDDSIVVSFKTEVQNMAEELNSQYENDPSVLLLLSEVYSALGNNEKKISSLIDYVQKNPEQYYVWENLLLELNDKGENDLLYKYSKQASTRFNKMPLPKMLYSFAAIEKKEYDLAEKELEKVRILVNRNEAFIVQILSLEAEIAYRRGNMNKAAKKFSEALLLEPENIVIMNNYAYYLAESDMNLSEARKMIKKCIEKERNITYMDTYAWILYKEGKYREAEKVMIEIFESEAIGDSDILEHYGYIKFEMGKCKEAVVLWQGAIRISEEKEYLIKEIEKCIGKE